MKKIISLLIIILFAPFSYSQYWMQNNVGYFTNYASPLINDASFINAQNGAVIIYDQGSRNKISVWKTLNKGSVWYNATGDFNASIQTYWPPAMKFINANTGFIVTVIDDYNGYHLKIYKTTNAGINTTNNGANWYETQTLDDYCNYTAMPKIEFINENTGYISSQWSIFKTTNCGQSWDIILQWNQNNPFRIYDFQISPINSNIIFAAGGYYYVPKVLKSENGGINWEVYASGTGTGALSVKKLSIVNENNAETIRGVADNGVVRCESGEVNLIFSPQYINDGNYIELHFGIQMKGFLVQENQ